MSDTTDNLVIDQCWQSEAFLNRVRLRFINAAIAATTESSTAASHTQRLAFAGALLSNSSNVDLEALGMAVVSNATIRAEVLANTAFPGGNATDSDIDFQVASVFTGIATSRSW